MVCIAFIASTIGDRFAFPGSSVINGLWLLGEAKLGGGGGVLVDCLPPVPTRPGLGEPATTPPHHA